MNHPRMVMEFYCYFLGIHDDDGCLLCVLVNNLPDHVRECLKDENSSTNKDYSSVNNDAAQTSPNRFSEANIMKKYHCLSYSVILIIKCAPKSRARVRCLL